jgi:hypothetical protein
MSVTRINVWLCVVLFALGCATVVPAQQPATPPPPLAGTGTTNFIPIWSNSTTLGNSTLFQTGGNVSIGNTTPASKLDVSGGAIIRGTLQLPPSGTATALKGLNSQPLDLVGSAFNSTIATAVGQRFRWQTEAVGNNSPSPSGKLNLLFAPGAAVPAETGVSISNTGNVTAKRLFSTVATGTAPFSVSSTTQVTNLNASFLGGFGSTAFARLAAPNTFTANQSITGNLSVTGSVSGGVFSGNGSGLTSVNAALLNGLGSGAFAAVGSNNTFTGAQTLAPTFPAPALTFADDGVSGDLQPSLLVNAVDCCSFGDRMIWAHSPAFPGWGILYDDSGFDGPADTMHWQRSTGTDVMSIQFGSGNLNVTGAITAGVKDFKIDHPLDPTNKYLYHSSVESSEMMNIYTGNAILDNSGEAVVSLPKWFEALNRDFRYQLTAVGYAAPNLHVAQEIANHQFSIGGGTPGMKVSWQVTGVRHDAYAKTHPLAVEVKKSAKERGHYLHPDAFGAATLTQEEMLRQR